MNIQSSYNTLITEIKKDCNINALYLEDELLNSAEYMGKYILLHSKFKLRQYRYNDELNELRLKRVNYYKGNGTPAEYRDNPFSVLVKSNADMEKYLSADTELNEFRAGKDILDLCVDMSLEMATNMRYRANTIKTIVELRKFEAGE